MEGKREREREIEGRDEVVVETQTSDSRKS